MTPEGGTDEVDEAAQTERRRVNVHYGPLTKQPQ